MKDIKNLLPLDIKNQLVVNNKTATIADKHIINHFLNSKIFNQTFYKPISKIIKL
jgi:hypothetical protein